MGLVFANVPQAQAIRWTVEVSSKIFDCADVMAYGIFRKVTTLEFFQHHFAKSGHGDGLLMTRQLISTFRQPPLHYLTRSVRRTSGFVLADHPPRIVACPDTAELLSLGARYTVFESRFVPFYGTRREARLGLIYHAGRQTNLSRQSVAGCDTPGRDCTYRIPRPLPHPWDRRPMAANDHHDGIANS